MGLGKPTHFIPSFVHGVEHLAQGGAAAYGQSVCIIVYAYRIQLAQIQCQTALELSKGGRISMTTPCGEKGDVVRAHKLDL